MKAEWWRSILSLRGQWPRPSESRNRTKTIRTRPCHRGVPCPSRHRVEDSHRSISASGRAPPCHEPTHIQVRIVHCFVTLSTQVAQTNVILKSLRPSCLCPLMVIITWSRCQEWAWASSLATVDISSPVPGTRNIQLRVQASRGRERRHGGPGRTPASRGNVSTAYVTSCKYQVCVKIQNCSKLAI